MQVIAQRIGAVIFRIEANVGGDTRQNVVGSDKNAIAFAEKADMPIGMARRPDDAVLFTQYIQVLPVLDHSKLFVWWDANNTAHLVRRDAREPLLVHRHAMLAKKL